METKKIIKGKNPCTNGCIHYSYNDTVKAKPNVTTGNGAKVFHGTLGHYCKKHNYYMVLVDNVPDVIQCDDFSNEEEKVIDYQVEINGLKKQFNIMENILEKEEIIDYSQDIKEIREKIDALNIDLGNIKGAFDDSIHSKFHIENMTGNIKT